MRDPLVSVVVPVLNGERYLGEALDSIASQDYQPVEVIVVDGGSTDRSRDVAASFPGVRILVDRSPGPGAASNTGIAAARGSFVAFVDSDDIILPNKVSTQVAYLGEHPEVSGVLARQEVFVEEGAALPASLKRDRIFGDVGGVGPNSGVFRMEPVREVGGYDPSYRYTVGLSLLSRLRAAGYRVEVLPVVLMRRRFHGGNITYGGAEMRQDLLRLVRERTARRNEETQDDRRDLGG